MCVFCRECFSSSLPPIFFLLKHCSWYLFMLSHYFVTGRHWILLETCIRFMKYSWYVNSNKWCFVHVQEKQLNNSFRRWIRPVRVVGCVCRMCVDLKWHLCSCFRVNSSESTLILLVTYQVPTLKHVSFQVNKQMGLHFGQNTDGQLKCDHWGSGNILCCWTSKHKLRY